MRGEEGAVTVEETGSCSYIHHQHSEYRVRGKEAKKGSNHREQQSDISCVQTDLYQDRWISALIELKAPLSPKPNHQY